MSAYDSRRGGGHFSAAIPENAADPFVSLRESEVKRLREHEAAWLTSESARCSDTGEPFCTCSAHIPRPKAA